VTELVIETTGLRKEYRRGRGNHLVAVDDLDLAVPRGGVHGFLGPNGSGKTTTIRMLLGLVSPTAGTARVLGEEVPGRLSRVMDRIGAVVEEPKFSPGLSGRRNLSLLARSRGLPASRIDEALKRVGLTGRERDRYKSYSLGMRQRLAIAATLLKSPDLLVLDEPTNGLDPAGIRDIRELVRELGRSDVTVLLSSHILAEVQQVCDSVSIISGGRLLSSGPVQELVGRETGGGVRVGVHDADSASKVLTAAGLRVTTDNGHLYVEGVADPADVTRLLAERGIYVRELTTDRPDLETVFLRLTEGGVR